MQFPFLLEFARWRTASERSRLVELRSSVTSTSNAHIHPMSSVAIEDMVYYLRYRNDTYIASRLCDAVGWSCQTYNLKDGEYGYGRVGWMSERFCHCQGFWTRGTRMEACAARGVV